MNVAFADFILVFIASTDSFTTKILAPTYQQKAAKMQVVKSN